MIRGFWRHDLDAVIRKAARRSCFPEPTVKPGLGNAALQVLGHLLALGAVRHDVAGDIIRGNDGRTEARAGYSLPAHLDHGHPGEPGIGPPRQVWRLAMSANHRAAMAHERLARTLCRPYPVFFLPWQGHISAGTAMKSQVVARYPRIKERTLNPRVRIQVSGGAPHLTWDFITPGRFLCVRPYRSVATAIGQARRHQPPLAASPPWCLPISRRPQNDTKVALFLPPSSKERRRENFRRRQVLLKSY